MRLIVGLGNPGKKYEGTRHNVGFDCLDLLAEQYGEGRWREKFHGQVQETRLADQKVWLLKPLTYMNRSGQAARAAFDFFQLAAEEVLVICDDLNLPTGQLRFRSNGSAGGQKGLHDILQHLETQGVPRLRIGVGQPPPRWDVADYVLSRFPAEEQEAIEKSIQRGAKGAALWVSHGIADCMNQYNAKQ